MLFLFFPPVPVIFLSMVLCLQNRSRNALLKLNFAHCSYARSLGVDKGWDSASLQRRYVEADGPVVAELGRRPLKKVCCGSKDVLDEGPMPRWECKEAAGREHTIPRRLLAQEVLRCGGKSLGAGVRGKPPACHPRAARLCVLGKSRG